MAAGPEAFLRGAGEVVRSRGGVRGPAEAADSAPDGAFVGLSSLGGSRPAGGHDRLQGLGAAAFRRFASANRLPGHPNRRLRQVGQDGDFGGDSVAVNIQTFRTFEHFFMVKYTVSDDGKNGQI